MNVRLPRRLIEVIKEKYPNNYNDWVTTLIVKECMPEKVANTYLEEHNLVYQHKDDFTEKVLYDENISFKQEQTEKFMFNISDELVQEITDEAWNQGITPAWFVTYLIIKDIYTSSLYLSVRMITDYCFKQKYYADFEENIAKNLLPKA